MKLCKSYQKETLSLCMLVLNMASLVMQPVLLRAHETEGIKQMRKSRTKRERKTI